MSNASSEPARNAIERLREMAYELCGDDNGTDHPLCRKTFDAVAAVDALYQAAKDVLAYGHGRTAYAPTALAAAVSRIEGNGSQREPVRRVESGT